MNLVKKLLIAHGDQKIRRRLVLFLAAAGYDLRAFGTAEAALESARNEWFDLALVDYELSGARDFSPIEALKKIQPTVPIILCVQKLELPVIVKGIRMGVTDVLARDNLVSVVRRAAALLNPNRPEPAERDSVTADEMAEVEAVLDRITGRGAGQNPDACDHAENDLPSELLRGAKERAMLEAKNARLEIEKAALEAELKTLLSQIDDSSHLEADFADLGSQREIASAAQAAIDEKARKLAEIRGEIARERLALEEQRIRAAADQPEGTPAKERTELAAWRARLEQEDDRIRAEAARLQHESNQIAQERRRWHDDLDQLREQETNLRDYETRLRQVQAQLEADRVLWFSARNSPSRSPFVDDPLLKEAWQKLQRASELLEAERANFCDEKLAFAEYEVLVRHREEKAREVTLKNDGLNKLQTSLSSSLVPADVSVGAATISAVKSISRAPFDMAKAVFSGKKTGE
ncbi:MAG TPA: response regulator [Opitutaceae bacterium]|jgi:DNA-binding response OmpR family regulator|nr:response regulator [Opitutaceae bacterium]